MSERNPEQDTLDAIDELVNETMAAGLDRWGYPRDDYNADRYPSCPGCDHQWHGIECQHCHCPGSEGEVLPPRPDCSGIGPAPPTAAAFAASLNEVTGEVHHTCYPDPRGRCAWPGCDSIFRVPCACSCWGCLHVDGDRHCGGASRGCHRSRDLPFSVDVTGTDEDPHFDIPEPMRGAPWVNYHEDTGEFEFHNLPRGPEPQGYTIADVERMRSQPYVSQSYVVTDYPQRFVLGEQVRRQVRFWWHDEAANRWTMVEGTPEVMRITWGRDGTSVAMRLDLVRQQQINDEAIIGVRPASVPGMITMEGATIPEGFEPIGFLHPEDLDLEYNAEYVQAFDGRAARVQEEYQATIRFGREAAQAQPLRSILPELEAWDMGDFQ